MPGKLLILTFHGAGVLTGEDLRFKESAIASGLVNGDAMDETDGGAGPKPFFDAHKDDLLQPPKAKEPGGLDLVMRSATQLVTLNRLGRSTWERHGFRRSGKGQSLFEQWLEKVFAVPIEVLVLAGHHSGGLVWGSEVIVGRTHHPFSALAPSVSTDGSGKSMVEIVASIPSAAPRRVAGPFDVSKALASCRMLVILGCNGATSQIKPWRDAIKNASGGRAPFIFGVRGVHSFPRDVGGQFLSPTFWNRIEALAPGPAGSKNLDFLHDAGFRDRILDLWRDVMKVSFPLGSPRRHLFFAGGSQRGPRGAGAVDPEGNAMWVINAAGDIAKGEVVP